MIRLIFVFAFISTFSFGSIPDIKRHSFDETKLKELGFSKVTIANQSQDDIHPYIFLFPIKYEQKFVVQGVTLLVFAGKDFLFSTSLDISEAPVKFEEFSSSFFYIKDKTLTYKLEIMYDTLEKETPSIREGHIIEINDFLSLPAIKYQELF